MRLTLRALLLTGGEALGQQSSSTCLASTTGDSTSWTVSMLAMVNFILMLAVLVLIKIAYSMHKRVELTRHKMDWISHELRKRMDGRQIRAEVQATTGIYRNDDESEEEEQHGSDQDEGDEAAWIRMVKREGDGEESGMEEVEIDTEMDDGYDCDMEDDHAVGGAGAESMEESKESGFETDYGSLTLNVIQEQDSDFENLDEEAYDTYRFRPLGEGRGVEHYILKKLAELRKMTMCEQVWYEIQLGSSATRQEVIDYLMNRRRYDRHFRAGRMPAGEGLEESDMPDAWVAAHYGWNQFRVQPGPREDKEVSWLGDDDDGGAAAESPEAGPAGPHEDPISEVVDAVAELATALDGESERASPKAKARAGGKGRNGHNGRDPFHEDEADV